MYTTIRPSTSRPYCFTETTTPTIVNFRAGLNHTCLPTALAPDGGQKRLANLLSMMTTGSAFCGRSASVKARPVTSGIRIVLKYLGVTPRWSTWSSCPGSGVQPSTLIDPQPTDEVNGRAETAARSFTPGTLASCSP